MRSFFEIVKDRFLRVSFFVFLFSMLIGSYVVLAGGLPPDVRQDSNIEEMPAEAPPVETVVEAPVVEEVPEKTSRGFTVGARGSFFLLGDSDFSAPGSEQYGPLSGTASDNGGYNFSFLLGYDFGNGLRLEAEAGYIHSCINEMDVKEPGSLVCLAGGCDFYNSLPSDGQEAVKEAAKGEKNIDGGVSAFALMINAYYDLNPDGKLIPYVGAGLGVLNLSTDAESAEGAATGTVLIDDSDFVFAYQVGAGLGYKIDGPGNGSDVTLSVDYRYLASFENPEFAGEITGGTVETEFAGHYLGGGIRLAF
ncbi:MAG: outer membrane beta-barrel protein [Candidatus Dadabacteria bacterium]|nr:outer membrane beta-barrel protein [Candidatus Dadabacteria bacterium]MYB26310.1 outer membrane beta-barrel protein [Candidatus Dadabacteria bacterium]